MGSSVISCVIPGKDSLKSTQCNYHYIPLIFHKILPRGESTRCGVKRERGGEVIPGRKGVGGSLRPGQTIPGTSPPPPTEAAHQGAAAARQGHPQAPTPASLALEGPEVQIVTLGNNQSARWNLLRISGPLYSSVCKITGRIVIT